MLEVRFLCFRCWCPLNSISLLAVVPSQCILARTLKKANAVMSVTTKVALQLNCKLGGELWSVDFPVSGRFFLDYLYQV